MSYYHLYRSMLALLFLFFLIVGVFGGIYLSRYKKEKIGLGGYFESVAFLFCDSYKLNKEGQEVQVILRKVFVTFGFLFFFGFFLLGWSLTR